MERYPAWEFKTMKSPLTLSLCIALPLGMLALPQEPAADAAQEAAKPKEVAPTVVEPETKIAFPTWMDVLDGERHHLLGMGVREKTIFKVNVYGFGYYVDRDKAAKVLRKAGGERMTLKKALKDQRFINQFMTGDFNKSMRWVMARDVDGEDVAEAFDEFLEPGIRRLARDDKQLEKGLAAMAEMRAYFASGKLNEDDELKFVWEMPAKMHTILNGRELGVIDNWHLCYALFDVFLGEKPIDKSAKRDIVEGMYPHVYPEQ
jgi:hypothetical protein